MLNALLLITAAARSDICSARPTHAGGMPGRRVRTLVCLVLFVAVQASHAAAVHSRGLLNSKSTAARANAGVPQFVQSTYATDQVKIPTQPLIETRPATGYVSVLQQGATPAGGQRTGPLVLAPQQAPGGRQQPALQPVGTSSTTEAGTRSQQVIGGMPSLPRPPPPPPGIREAPGVWPGGGNSDDDGVDEGDEANEDMSGSEAQTGSDPFAGSTAAQAQQQQQRPRGGRSWAEKFPFPHCVDATLTFDVSFVGPVQSIQVGTVRYAYHRFGPLSDAPPEPPAAPFSKVLRTKPGPVVFIAGWGMNMYMWPVPLLRALAATRTVIIFDNMRTGSSTDASKAQLTIPLMADSTAGLIQQLRLDKPDIWSWSLGAAVGYALLARHANKVGNVILAAGTPGGPSALMPPTKVWQAVTTVGQDYTQLLPLLFPAGQSDPGVCNLFAAFNSFSEGGRLTSPLGRQSLGEQGDALRAFFNDPSIINRLNDVPNRVLIMHGVQDALMPVRNAVMGAQRLLGAWMLQFPGEGHAIPFSNPPAVIAMTQEFFTFASALNSSSIKMWANYGVTYTQQLQQLGRLQQPRR